MNTPVSFELAKLLREKRVNIMSSKFMYASNGKLTDSVYDFDDWCFAPTIAEVVMWLYEKHEIWISVDWLLETQNKWHYLLTRNLKNSVWISDGNSLFNSPTEAYEAAIEYTLKNLI